MAHRDPKPDNMLIDMTDHGYPEPPPDALVARAMVRLFLAMARVEARARGEITDLGVRPAPASA
jgi:hypothetical protein